MTQQQCPFETMPIKDLALRVQANPRLAMELPGSPKVPSSLNQERRVRFVLEAALLGELDNRELVESVPPLKQEPSSFDELKAGLDEVYNPRVEKLLGKLHRTRAWRPFFTRSRAVFENCPNRPNDPLEAYREIISDTARIMVSDVERVAITIKGRFDIHDNTRIAVILRNNIPQWRKVAHRGRDGAEMISRDMFRGDPNKILLFDESADRLRFRQRLGQCPVGSQGLVVDDLDDIMRRRGYEPLGCPVFKTSRLAEKLLLRAIDEGENHQLLAAA